MIRRAFIAVVPPDAVLDAVDEHLRGQSFAGWRRARREQRHVTLEFLGHVDDETDVIDRLQLLAGGLERFPVRLGGAGAFPRVDRATAVWLGVASGAPELRGLAAVLRSVTEPPFREHLTVARSNRPRAADALVAALDAPTVGPSWEVDAVELIASDTHPSGARYTTVARLALGG